MTSHEADIVVSATLRILHVEDSPDDAELVRRALLRGLRVPFELIGARDAESTRRALASGRIDLVLSDWFVPGFGAMRALELVRAAAIDVPFIVVSGVVGEETAVEAMIAGAQDYVLKDRLARLPAAIEREIRDRDVRRARTRAEAALHASELRYRRIVEATTDGVWILDRAGKTTFVNARMAEMLGVSADRALGLDALACVAPAAVPRMREILRGRRASGAAGDIELTREGAASRWTLIGATPIATGDGADATLLMVRDITERQRLESQLLQAQKLDAVGRLAGGIAHDFNNMLTVILSYSGFLIDQLPEGDLRADARELNTAGQHAAELTRQLLAFSRRQLLAPRVVQPNAQIAAMESMLRRVVGEDVEVTMLLDPSVGNVYADPSQLEQIVMNLVVNARDAMPRGGAVTIATRNVVLDESDCALHVGVTPGRYVRMAVTDTGQGIAPALLPRIFEPFFTTKEQGKGTGLGLSTVHGIVSQSGGHVRVTSELERGTNFEVYLPRIDAPASRPPPPPESSASPRGGTETILVAEDEDQVRHLITTVLRRHGYEVIEAKNGGEALLACERHPSRIDLLVTDVIMPRMSGRELAERLAPLRPEMRVLYVSGYCESAIAQHGVVDAGRSVLLKPLTPDALLRKVRTVLDEVPRAATPSEA
jgi:PAS domain S-box-containing protein